MENLKITKSYEKFYLEVHLFYSFSDIQALLGRTLAFNIAENLMCGKRIYTKDYWLSLPLRIVDKYQGIGYALQIHVVDWFGIEYTSLIETCRIYNIDMVNKSIMDKYKSCMNVPYQTRSTREDFIRYACSDLVLWDLYNKYRDHYINLCSLLNIKDDVKCPPMTKGSRVVRLFKKMLNSKLSVSIPLLKGVDLSTYGGHDISHLLTLYGCKSLCTSDPSLTKRHLTTILGGRVRNESPIPNGGA